MKNHTKISSLSLITFASSLLIGCMPSTEPKQQHQQTAPKVSVATVIKQRVTEWDEFTGRLQAPPNSGVTP